MSETNHLINISIFQGFEWNKYNQTHYDMDNPPPKVVQGYKFNVSQEWLILIKKRNPLC